MMAFLIMPGGLWAADSLFEPPVRLMADGKFINDNGKMLYPTPVLMDIDNDQRQELVIGDLWGVLWIAENQGKSGDPVWSSLKKLKGANGKELKVPNW